MAPDGAGASVVWGNMDGSMSPRGVRGVLGPREEDTVPGAIDFCREAPAKNRETAAAMASGALWERFLAPGEVLRDQFF